MNAVATPVNSTPPKPKVTSAKKSSSAAKAGTKRKKMSSQTDSDYEDEEFKVREEKGVVFFWGAGKGGSVCVCMRVGMIVCMC